MHSKKITVRFASAISAAVIGFTSTAISFFDCPVYAAYGGAAWGEFFGFYSLLEGFGFGQDNSDFINSVDNWIDSLQPEEKPREDYDGEWMTDAQYWQQCQYDKFTGWLDNLVGSWSESYDAVGDVGSGGASSSFGHLFPLNDLPNGFYSCGGISVFGDGRFGTGERGHYMFPSTFSFNNLPVDQSTFVIDYYLPYTDNIYSAVAVVDGYYRSFYCSKKYGWIVAPSSGQETFSVTLFGKYWAHRDSDSPFSYTESFCLSSNQVSISDDLQSHNDPSISFSSGAISTYFSFLGVDLSTNYSSLQDVVDYLNSITDFSSFSIAGKHYDASEDSNFIGPVYTYPAAQELARQNQTSTGIRLDVNTADGVPDVKAALDGAGVSTVDELAASVAAGDVAMQDVFADAKVTPYVVADTTTGVVVTDLGVAADAAGVKPVALTKELTVPADLTTAATYAIQGKTWDPDMAKYRLPLFQYFPFCLPWDIYQVLNSFAADPVAPQIEIPIGKFFANKKSFDGSAVANYTETLDLGDEKFSKWFSALRLLESAGIIIGLVLISVHLIHGGR